MKIILDISVSSLTILILQRKTELLEDNAFKNSLALSCPLQFFCNKNSSDSNAKLIIKKKV